MVEDSLSSLHERYHSAGLMQINRSTLVNIAIVKGYTKGPRRDTLQLIIQEEYIEIPTMQNTSLFVVTKEHLDTFKTQMEVRFDTP